MALPFLGADCFTQGRHGGVCLLHWRGLEDAGLDPLLFWVIVVGALIFGFFIKAALDTSGPRSTRLESE